MMNDAQYISYTRCPQLTDIEEEILLLPATTRGKEVDFVFFKV
jgi:hypothetical protein